MKLSKAVVLVLAGLLFSAPAFSQQPEPLRIGALLPMTGQGASLGVSISSGMKAAIDQVNQSGGILGRQVELVIGDDAGDPAQGTNEARRLALVNKVRFVLGSFNTGVTLAAMPIFMDAKVLQFSSAASTDVSVARGPYHFTTQNADPETQASNFVDYAVNVAKVKKVAVFSDTTASYRSVAEFTKRYAAQRGLTITAVEFFEPHATDLLPQLLDARHGSPDMLWVIGIYPADMGVVMKGVKEINWKVPLAGGLGLGSQARALLAALPADQIIDHVAQNFVGWTYCSNQPVGDAPIPRTLNYLKDKVPDFDKQLSVGMLMGYDTVMMLKQVYTATGSFDTVTATNWIEQNSDKLVSIVHKYHKVDKTTHFLIGTDGVAMAENPYRPRSDGLTKRVGC